MSQDDNTYQLMSYKNMLDSMVEMLQLTGIILKQRLENSTNPSGRPVAGTALDCESECIACNVNRGQICEECTQEIVPQVPEYPCPGQPCLDMVLEAMGKKEKKRPSIDAKPAEEEPPEESPEGAEAAVEEASPEEAPPDEAPPEEAPPEEAPPEEAPPEEAPPEEAPPEEAPPEEAPPEEAPPEAAAEDAPTDEIPADTPEGDQTDVAPGEEGATDETATDESRPSQEKRPSQQSKTFPPPDCTCVKQLAPPPPPPDCICGKQEPPTPPPPKVCICEKKQPLSPPPPPPSSKCCTCGQLRQIKSMAVPPQQNQCICDELRKSKSASTAQASAKDCICDQSKTVPQQPTKPNTCVCEQIRKLKAAAGLQSTGPASFAAAAAPPTSSKVCCKCDNILKSKEAIPPIKDCKCDSILKSKESIPPIKECKCDSLLKSKESLPPIKDCKCDSLLKSKESLPPIKDCKCDELLKSKESLPPIKDCKCDEFLKSKESLPSTKDKGKSKESIRTIQDCKCDSGKSKESIPSVKECTCQPVKPVCKASCSKSATDIEAAEGGRKPCIKTAPGLCSCKGKSEPQTLVCACPPTEKESQALQDSIIERLGTVQKQIDLLRVDLENLSGKSKSAALYKEIMKPSAVDKAGMQYGSLKSPYNNYGAYPIGSKTSGRPAVPRKLSGNGALSSIPRRSIQNNGVQNNGPQNQLADCACSPKTSSYNDFRVPSTPPSSPLMSPAPPGRGPSYTDYLYRQGGGMSPSGRGYNPQMPPMSPIGGQRSYGGWPQPGQMPPGMGGRGKSNLKVIPCENRREEPPQYQSKVQCASPSAFGGQEAGGGPMSSRNSYCPMIDLCTKMFQGAGGAQAGLEQYGTQDSDDNSCDDDTCYNEECENM